ncbi:MAG: methyltransferase domain-containing protein [Luteitalea sp.]|nr:methyltransferase domain-containing protein [Luteitalea sp.]
MRIRILMLASLVACADAVSPRLAPDVVAAAQAVPPEPARTPDIHFAATPQPVVYAMLELAQVTANDTVFDLGSGDGRLVILAAQKYGARGVGVELQPRLVELSRAVAEEGGVADRVRFIAGDLFDADISDATVVVLWLSQTVNTRLAPKLKRELRPGTRIVSHQFPIEGWTPKAIVRADYDGTDLFLWTIPPP